jgi:hypothetical protein
LGAVHGAVGGISFYLATLIRKGVIPMAAAAIASASGA